MTAPTIAIVGSGRSGSGYIARVLCEAGVPCGHESHWNPFGEQLPGLAADSSWCALALGLGDYPGIVLHQVRHPLDVVSSLLKCPTTEGPYLALQSSLIERRLLWVPANDIEFACAAWLCYTREADALAAWGWRVEDVDGPLVQRIALHAGLAVGRWDAEDAVDTIPCDWNQHGEGPRLSWDDLPDGPIVTALRADATRWGYE